MYWVQARAVDAVSRVGTPIMSAAITTIMAVSPMLLCTIQILKKFGVIILLNMVLSIVFGLLFYVPVLMTVGPEREFFWGKNPGPVMRQASKQTNK